MKALARNKRTLYYANPSAVVDVLDEDDLYSGQREVQYETPIEVRMNYSPVTGNTDLQAMGITDNYAMVIVTDWMECPFTEETMLWLDPNSAPEYIVTKVARSLNSILYACRAVDEGVHETNNN